MRAFPPFAANARPLFEHERLLVHAQPILDLGSGEVAYYELLVRMSAEDGSIVAPGQFLPAAEERGVIQDIDRWMLGHAALLAACGIPVTLNLSAAAVAEAGMVDEFRGEIETTGADSSLIVVELSGAALLENQTEAGRFCAGLREVGCKLGLKGFGAGAGDFGSLKPQPLDLLKIDPDFVRDVPDDEAGRDVVCAAVELARRFGQRTVAEGVESERALQAVRELGVDFAQGFHVERPKPIDQAVFQPR